MSIASPWSRRWRFILVLWCLAQMVPAQVVQSGRFEMALNDQEAVPFAPISLGVKGLVWCRQIQGRETDVIEVTRLDTALHEQFKTQIIVSKAQNLLRVDYHKDSLFLLFKDRLYLGGDFQLISMHLMSGRYSEYLIKNIIPFAPTEFVVTQKAALIGGYYNYRPIVLHFSFSNRRSRVLPGFFNSQGDLDQLTADENGNLEVVVCARNENRKKSLWVRSYDAEGELIKTTIVQPEERKNLLFAHTLASAYEDQTIAGVYGRHPDYSRGIFLTQINATGQYATRYHNFSELSNFFSYLKSGRQKRIKERIARKTSDGKKIKFNYRFLIHDVIAYKGQFIMTGEAFYPHFHYSSITYSISGLPTSNYAQSNLYSGLYGRSDPNLNFDFFQYTHAVIIGFDRKGNILWDNSFEINDAKTRQLGQFVKVLPEKDRIVMVYLFDNVIHSKVIRGAEVIENKSNEPVKAMSDDEIIDPGSAENENLDAWYGPYFFASGVQRVRENTGPWHPVFYINKISVK